MYVNPLLFMILFTVCVKLVFIYGKPLLRLLKKTLGVREAQPLPQGDFIRAIEGGLLHFDDDAA